VLQRAAESGVKSLNKGSDGARFPAKGVRRTDQQLKLRFWFLAQPAQFQPATTLAGQAP
jgi:hypothetical protein